MPRRFDPTDDDRIIFDEEDVVSELYLIVEGTVGIGYNMVGPKNNKGGYQIAKKLKKPRDPAIVICDHYVLNKKRSQFLYVALKEVHAFALRKKYLNKEVLPKYHDIAECM